MRWNKKLWNGSTTIDINKDVLQVLNVKAFLAIIEFMKKVNTHFVAKDSNHFLISCKISFLQVSVHLNILFSWIHWPFGIGFFIWLLQIDWFGSSRALIIFNFFLQQIFLTRLFAAKPERCSREALHRPLISHWMNERKIFGTRKDILV